MLNHMTEIKEHEYKLLSEIAQDSLVTQASLSKNLGIAVGSVNWYIKRLIQRGWVKVSHLDRTRLKYDLTPEGMVVFTQRAILYARDSLKVYGQLRKKASVLIAGLKKDGVKSVYLEGNDEAMDILKLTCIENGMGVHPSPNGLVLKTDGQNYQVVTNGHHRIMKNDARKRNGAKNSSNR
jgi:DNA-binding MarR family transcriptional regulator